MSSEVLVTDTHPLVWYFCTDHHKLSKKVKKAFDDALHKKSNAIYVPSPVLVELSMLIENGRINLGIPFEHFLEKLFRGQTIIEQPLDRDVVSVFHELTFSADPFDRMIVATAKFLQLPLISADSLIHEKQPCDLFW